MKDQLSLTQKLYDHGKRLIPGGTQLLSKRPEMFLPDTGLPTSRGPEDVNAGTWMTDITMT